MEVNPNIFKAYDIRGIYPKEVNEEVAYKIGIAFVKFLAMRPASIVLGRDGRLSSPALFRALIKGMVEQGAKVTDIGLSTSPMLYWACAYFKFDGGIEITASHNPPEYNGFKLIRAGAVPISERSGLKEIKKLVLKAPNPKVEKPGFSKGEKSGFTVKKNVLRDYLKFNLKGINLKKIKPLRMVVDTANSVSGIVIPEISKKTPFKIYHLFQKLDGNFPNHNPDPLIKENLSFLRKEVLKRKADLGVAFDGDGDRIIFVAENGRIISADLISALISKLILEKNPAEKILYDVRSSNIVKETIEKAGGIPVISRVGHSFIKERMKKENIIFAGEFSGHYYHRSHYFCEAPLFVLFKISQKLSESPKSISRLIKPYQKYFHSGEINFKVENKEKKIKELKNRYRRGKILEIDGLRVDFRDWWFLVRPSNTEPVLRLVIEAETKELMEGKKKEITKIIQAPFSF